MDNNQLLYQSLFKIKTNSNLKATELINNLLKLLYHIFSEHIKLHHDYLIKPSKEVLDYIIGMHILLLCNFWLGIPHPNFTWMYQQVSKTFINLS